MRCLRNPQTTFRFQHTASSTREQWEKIGEILQANPAIAQRVWEDLCRGQKNKPNTGARGMTAEQVLRFALVKARLELPYRELFDRVDDSIVLREFCGVSFEKVPAFTTLQENIKRIRPETFAAINALIVGHAAGLGVEDGERIRVDSTAVESNIHHPTDSGLLWDCVRVLTRILRQVETEFDGLRGRFSDHTRVAKRLRYKINNSRNQNERKPLYKRLIDTTRKTVSYAEEAVAELASRPGVRFEDHLAASAMRNALEELLPLANGVIAQATRRVLNGEKVPAEEKIVSIFEPHTDIIVKGQREVVYGHKVFLSGGKSGLILDCAVEQGNPADSEQFTPLLERHRERTGRAPRDVAADGGFASAANTDRARQMGVENVVFSNPKGKGSADPANNTRLYKQLRKWRAGIEGVISAAKRAFGLDRCSWRSYESFQAYVQLAVLAFNLQTLARHLL